MFHNNYCFSEFEPTDQYDLYNAFNKAIVEDNSLQEYGDFDFEEYYRIWVNEPGYPLLEVEVDHTNGNIKLKQASSELLPHQQHLVLPSSLIEFHS